MESPSHISQAVVIEAFTATFRYVDVRLNIDKYYFEQMVDNLYLKDLQLYNTCTSEAEAPFPN